MLRGLIAVFIAAVMVGCALPFGPTECSAALAEGRLAPDGQGSALLVMDDRRQPVQWPAGYSVEPGPPVRLWGPGFQLIAEEGDTVYAGGGFTEGDELFIACGYVGRDPPH